VRTAHLTERSSDDPKLVAVRRYRAGMTDPRTGYARPSSAANSSVLVLVLWSWFVWGGRIRNVNEDATLQGWGYWGPMLLSVSFTLMAVVVVAMLWRRWRHPHAQAQARALSLSVQVLAGWTTVVWVVRAADIALGGDHEAAFVAVHVVLAAVSIGLAAWAVTTDRKVRSAEHTSALTASQENMA
jgi:hypothetical protein